MNLNSRGRGGSYLRGHGANFPQQDVVIVHRLGEPDETRTPSRGGIQSKLGNFDLDTPIREGDWVELDDPRFPGEVRRLYVAKVDVHDNRDNPTFAMFSRVTAHWGAAPVTRPSPPEEPRTVNYHGTVVNISGGTAQVAFDNNTVNQTSYTVPEGFDDIAKALKVVLERIEEFPEEDRPYVQEATESVLTAVVSESPDSGTIRRGLAQVRGFLASLSMAAARGVGAQVGSWATKVAEQLTF